MTTFKIEVCSPPDREKLTASILIEGIEWAEVNQEDSELSVEFYARPDTEPWEIDLNAAIAALTAAGRKLKEME